jgi:hypothetical protein
MTVTLEPARIADAPRLAAMSRELIENGLRPSWPAARIVWHIRHRESVVLKAAAGQVIAGFAIISWLEETALTAGTFKIGLELRATNLEARAFYGSLGYREIGRVLGYYEGVEDAIRMARDLRRIPAEADRLPRATGPLRPWSQGWNSSNY